MPRGRIRTMALLLALGACQREFDLYPTQIVPTSSTIASAIDGSAVYAVNVDEGTVSRLGTGDRSLSWVGVGLEPTRITRGADRLFVSLRGQREVVALEDTLGGLEIVGRVTVGAEPYGIVASQDAGGPVYVAVSLEDRVLELDPVTLETLRSWDIPGEPRWVALDPLGHALFVASYRGGRLSRIDLGDDAVSTIGLPRAERGHVAHDEEGLPPEGVEGDDWLTIRLTGDPCVSPNGQLLAVPALYLDTVSPVVGDAEEGGSGYGSEGTEVGRMNPSILTFNLEDGGEPTGYGNAVFAPGDDDGVKRTSLTSAWCAPDSRYILATMEATDAVMVVDTHGFTRAADPNVDPHSEVDAVWLGFAIQPLTEIATRRGPSGIALQGEDLYIHTWLDRTISKTRWEDAVEINAVAARDTRLGQYPVLGTRDPIELIGSALTVRAEEGRDLFTSALDLAMTSRQGGVACSTCHVDGREDGLTWPFASGKRQTLSLAGRSETGPFTWNGDVDSIADEALLTTTIRMGGGGPDDYELGLIEAYIATLRPADTPNRGRTDTLVTAGRAVFEASGCAVCHAGEATTDGLNHQVYGTVPINTPSLIGLAASAPYLHDGSLATLREVLALESMASTSSLDAAELDALEAYLLSL